MPVIIREIVSEVIVGPESGSERAPSATRLEEAQVEVIVRRAVDRVLERLRREWEA